MFHLHICKVKAELTLYLDTSPTFGCFCLLFWRADPTLFGSDCEELSSNDHRANCVCSNCTTRPVCKDGFIQLFADELNQNTSEYLEKGHLTPSSWGDGYCRASLRKPSSWKCFIEADAAKALHNVLWDADGGHYLYDSWLLYGQVKMTLICNLQTKHCNQTCMLK